MSILWEPPSEVSEPVRDVRGLQLGEEVRHQPHGVSPEPVGAAYCRDAEGRNVTTHSRRTGQSLYIGRSHAPAPRDAEDAPAGDKLIALVIGAVSGGMVGLVLGYALGVL